jgi:hypothetical protein
MNPILEIIREIKIILKHFYEIKANREAAKLYNNDLQH